MFMAAYIYSSLYPSSGEDNTLTNENEIIALEEDKAMLQRELNNAESRYKELEGRYNSLTGELEQANGRIDYLTGLRKTYEYRIIGKWKIKLKRRRIRCFEINYDSLELPENMVRCLAGENYARGGQHCLQ